MSDEISDVMRMCYLPTIDTEKLKAAIIKYIADNPQKSVGDESTTHVTMADFLPMFVDREFDHFPVPLVELYWPEMFWMGLMRAHGLFEVDAPEIRVEKRSEDGGVILFRGDEIGTFEIDTLEAMLARYDCMDATEPSGGIIKRAPLEEEG